jgi:hypothetical protein
MSDTRRKLLLENPELHPSRIVSSNGFRTALEQTIEDWLLERGLKFDAQHPVGQKLVDFWLPEERMILEADGAFWHQDQEVDIARDRELLAHVGDDVKIVHLHFFDPRFSPELVENPLPGVFYVACNPGPSTFWDPEMYEATEILEVNRRRYEGNQSLLYDLTVDGVHSFVASGIVISNSYQEFGTIYVAAVAYLRRAGEAVGRSYYRDASGRFASPSNATMITGG